LLRLGLRLAAHDGAWTGSWLAEVVGFDLAPGGGGATRLLGSQHVSLTLAPLGSTITPLGARLGAASVPATADWTGCALHWDVAATGITLARGAVTVGPLTLHVPPTGTFDPGAPELGLGLPVDDVLVLARALIADGLMSWGGLPLLSVGALLGLHHDIAELAVDWPLLQPPDPTNIGSLLADPLSALKRQVDRILPDQSAGGVPFSTSTLSLLYRNPGGFLPAGLAPSAAAAAAPSPAIVGAGSRQEPWAVPLGSGHLEGLVWLEPDGAAAAWVRHLAAQLAAVGHDPAALLALLPAVGGAVPEAAAALRGRVPASAADGLQRLETWLAGSDGIVPTASQVGVSGPWQVGAAITSAHPDEPAAPAAIAQIRGQLDAWAGGAGAGRSVLPLGPAFSDHRAWSACLATAEPGRSPQAHFDLRAPGIDPLTVDLSDITAAATHYTADLADAAAGVEALVGQLAGWSNGCARSRVAPPSSWSRTRPAGVLVRVYAAAHPDRVAGVVTLGTPHAGTPLSALADETLADAVRLARALVDAAGAAPVLRAIDFAASVLDGWVPLPSGRPMALGFPLAAFSGVPSGIVDTVRGLAIPGAVGGDLVGALAQALVGRASRNRLGRADAALAGDLAPTHACFGLRARLQVPAATAGAISVDARVRLDAGGVSPTPGVAPFADAPRASVIAAVERPGGWLVGRPGGDGPDGIRIRRAELGAVLAPATGRATAVTPIVRLHDRLTGAPARVLAELPDVVAKLPDLPDRLPLRITPSETGTPAALLRDALTGSGTALRPGAETEAKTGSGAGKTLAPEAPSGRLMTARPKSGRQDTFSSTARHTGLRKRPRVRC
jgi:hypothetical protein